MKKTIIAFAGAIILGLLLSVSVSAQTDVKKDDTKTIKKENTISTDKKKDCKTTKPPCDPKNCKSKCKSKQWKYHKS